MALRSPTGRLTAFHPPCQAFPLPAAGRHSIACQTLGVDPSKVSWSEDRLEPGVEGLAEPAKLWYVTSPGTGIDTHFHELLHILFPAWPHEAVYYWAARLSGAIHMGVPWLPMWKDERDPGEILRLARESAALRRVAI